MNRIEKKDDATHIFSIIVTERCNLNCSYCHFYKVVSRESRRDIPDDLFDLYMHFIKYFHEKVGGEVNYRFSGGDPIVLGNRLFDLSRRGYEITGIKPYILTAAKGVNEKWLEKAKKSAINHLFISIDNPISPDPGSTNPSEIMRMIKKYHSKELPLQLGVTIIKNKDFKDIYKVCKLVYEELGCLPKIQELNFKPYESPTDQELQDLYDNLVHVVREFYDKAPLDMFSYISPEFNAVHNKKETFLMEFNLTNHYQIGSDNFDESIARVFERQKITYPESACEDTECDWYQDCRRVKWLWKTESETVSAEQKFKDYCRLKKTVNSAFYDALKDKIDETPG
jgi:MoaA/NifB/PqqE/SkfB family radical SAM enzyme